ncbi:hypothetical protein HGH93_23055 [Chitinophaga polysaccharea]|uniref:hypothetical protein n=1 Tax=Chitinophaga TaxID=79328 RepID=UPI001455A050|nr:MULTISPECIES: hypothetical protein [Chitinophaga]NLR61000.1 hypothetical protein [Chitinophaga polysaccharea]NLU96209.1 hypothetical protein [Chitinophaga sp. Ak27]
MKIISAYTLLLLVCLVAVTTGVQAQANDTAAISRGRWTIEGRANKITDKISHKLNLNRAQTEKIYVINEDIVRRMDAVKKNASLSKKERMTQFKALDSERSQRFKTVFTASQYKKWNDWEMNKKEHLEARMEKKRQKKELKNGQ